MQAWRVHEFGEPRDVLVADELPKALTDMAERRTLGRVVVRL
jgi:hypothetical protein